MQCACGYKSGRTAEIICRELGLISVKWRLTKKGENYLWEVYAEADKEKENAVCSLCGDIIEQPLCRSCEMELTMPTKEY